MAVKNAYLAKLQQDRGRDMSFQRQFTIQQCKDMAVIALSECEGYGDIRSKRFLEAFDKAMAEWTRFALEDDCSDVDITYTKGKLDNRLRMIMGDDFPDFETRYPKLGKAVVYHNNIKHGRKRK